MNLISATLQATLVVGTFMVAGSLAVRLVMWLFRIPAADVRDGLDGRPDWTGVSYGWRMLRPGAVLVGVSSVLLLVCDITGVI